MFLLVPLAGVTAVTVMSFAVVIKALVLLETVLSEMLILSVTAVVMTLVI